MQDIELRNVEASSPLMRTLSTQEDNYIHDRVNTKYGLISVYRQGAECSTNKPILITYHDIGLNHVSNFQAFFNYMDMKLMLQSLTVLHVNAPGQEENAIPLPEDYVYPNLDQLAEQLLNVCNHYNVKHFIGFGVGFGANILSRFSLRNQNYLDGLFLINPSASASSWTEWFYQKFNIYSLNLSNSSIAPTNSNFPESTRDYLIWYHFGRITNERNRDLVELYRAHFSGKSINSRNLSLLIDSYIKRSDLGIVRGDSERNFKCPVLLLCGVHSPHVDDSVAMNARLDPSNSSWMKLQDCGMVLEEQPGKVAEALKLFIQGLGYALTVYERRRSSLRRMSLSSTATGSSVMSNGDYARKSSIEEETVTATLNGIDQTMRIVENPIAQC